MKMWVCVKQIDLQTLDKNIIFLPLYKPKNLEKDQMQKIIREKIDEKIFFFVLDDVWNENHEKLLSLKKLLIRGAKVSRILITTRYETIGTRLDTSKT